MAGLAGFGLPRNHQADLISASRVLRWNFLVRREFVTDSWIIYGWNLRSDMVQRLNIGVPVNGGLKMYADWWFDFYHRQKLLSLSDFSAR